MSTRATAEYRHPAATRSERRGQLQALVDRGATEGEREAARRALAAHDASHPATAESEDPQLAHIRQATAAHLAELGSIHDAEVHAGKIGMFVVWRVNQNAADWLQCFGGQAMVRLPDGQVMSVARCKGIVHDTEQDRWGVLYRAKDLRPNI